jgi:hypothetical protein
MFSRRSKYCCDKMIIYLVYLMWLGSPFREMDTSALSAKVTSSMKYSTLVNNAFVSFIGRNMVSEVGCLLYLSLVE